MSHFESIGVICNQPLFDSGKLDAFVNGMEEVRSRPTWIKKEIVELFFDKLLEFAHKETGKYLDQRM